MLNYLNDRTGLMADDTMALRVLEALQDVEHDETDGVSAYDLEDALDTDGDQMYTLCERYEFCNPYITLEEKYREFEADLTAFVKYMKEQS